MIDFLASFCSGLGAIASEVTLRPWHVPSESDAMDGEAPMWGRRNAILVEVRGDDVGWMNIVSPGLITDVTAAGAVVLAEEVRRKMLSVHTG